MLHGPRFHARMRHVAEQARHGHGELSGFCRLNGFVAPPLRNVTSVQFCFELSEVDASIPAGSITQGEVFKGTRELPHARR